MKSAYMFLLVALVVLSAGCKKETDYWEGFQLFESDYTSEELEKSKGFADKGASVGEVKGIAEASGLAVSEANQGNLWTHNDSGNPEMVFLLDANTGQVLATYRISGVTNDDWEDIACGPGPVSGNSYLYIADIGDNKSAKPERVIYRVQEPLFSESHRGQVTDLSLAIDKIRISYPEGPQNAETLLLDPVTLDLYVVTKFGVKSKLYVAKYPQSTTELNRLEYVGSFGFREATGGSVSKDGMEVFIKTYDKVFYWQTKKYVPLWKLLAEAPMLAPYNPIELQGEAIAVSDNGYFTLSEQDDKEIPVLYFYKRY